MNDSKTKKVLVIDDDKFYCSIYQGELGNFQDIEVSCVNNGKEGLDAVKKMSPDLVLLDIVMPEYDGFWFLEQRAKDPELMRTPVIVNSGVASLKDKKRVDDLGVSRFFSKLTLSPEQFAKRIHDFLSGKQPDWEKSRFLDTSMTSEGEELNEIFAKAADNIKVALSKFVSGEVKIGNLQATVSPIKTLQKYFSEFISGEEESIVIYSVLKPPVAAALLMVENSTSQKFIDIMEEQKGTDIDVGGLVKELYGIVANTFFNTITSIFHSEEVFVFHPAMLSTPDLAIKVLRKDGFIASDSKIHFVFRQQYIIKGSQMTFDFVLLLHEEGLEKLGGGAIKG